MTILVPLQAGQFEAFVDAAATSHAEDSVASGRWPAQGSAQRAREELERLLPQGIATPDHYVFEIRAETDDQTLGFVWFGGLPRDASRIAFVFQLFIYPAHRRQGHGRAALLNVESFSRRLGFDAIALNVFGSNVGAQALYRSLGYAVTSLSMRKPLTTLNLDDPCPRS